MPPGSSASDRAASQRPGTGDDQPPPLGTGYSHELIEVTERVRAGQTESVIMPLQDTLAVQRVLERSCEKLGVFHSEDTLVAVASRLTQLLSPKLVTNNSAESIQGCCL